MCCHCSARSFFTYSCEEPGCLPAAFVHVLGFRLCVCLSMCGCWPQSLQPLGTHSASYAYQQATGTHTHALSEIMFVPCSAGLFLGQQLQGLLNIWAWGESYNLIKGNELWFLLSSENILLIWSGLQSFSIICQTICHWCQFSDTFVWPVSRIQAGLNPLMKADKSALSKAAEGNIWAALTQVELYYSKCASQTCVRCILPCLFSKYSLLE